MFGLGKKVLSRIPDQNFDPSLLTNNFDWFSWKWSKKNYKITQKNWDFQNRQFSIFKKKIWIGPWVSTIEWCKGHWCGSTYMAMRLSKISSKTSKKCIFCVFRPFLSLCQTVSQPYRLSHINALRINQSY